MGGDTLVVHPNVTGDVAGDIARKGESGNTPGKSPERVNFFRMFDKLIYLLNLYYHCNKAGLMQENFIP